MFVTFFIRAQLNLFERGAKKIFKRENNGGINIRASIFSVHWIK